MQEISPRVFIETSYAGVTLGAINSPHGLILINSPFRPDDVRSWRSSLFNVGVGIDRLLINLDAHFDRTLGVRAMECTVVAQEKVAAVFRNRPVTFKLQNAETGSEWELTNGLGSIRWSPPDLTFSQRMMIHFDDSPMSLEYHPGPASGSSWVVLPEQKIVFVGDAVVPDQPPFLANADIPTWLETLKILLEPAYQDFTLVCGRGGLITHQEVRDQIEYLTWANHRLEALAEKQVAPEDTEILIPEFISRIESSEQLEAHFQQRLRWGLYHYFGRHYRQMSTDFEE